MEVICLKNYSEEVEFAKRAGRHFAENSNHHTFTDCDIDESTFLAVRWGLLEDCVVVIKRNKNHKPKIYEGLGRRK